MEISAWHTSWLVLARQKPLVRCYTSLSKAKRASRPSPSSRFWTLGAWAHISFSCPLRSRSCDRVVDLRKWPSRALEQRLVLALDAGAGAGGASGSRSSSSTSIGDFVDVSTSSSPAAAAAAAEEEQEQREHVALVKSFCEHRGARNERSSFCSTKVKPKQARHR